MTFSETNPFRKLFALCTIACHITCVSLTHGSETVRQVLDLATGAGSSFPEVTVVTNGLIYFSATTDACGRELWRSDGTEDGTFLLKDIYPGYTVAPDASYPDDFETLGSMVVFRATDPVHGRELWVSDGTTEGTKLLADIEPGTNGSTIDVKGHHGGLLYFVAGNTEAGRELWRTDGTPGGTFQLRDIYVGAEWSSPEDVTVVGDKIVFLASDAAHGKELWATDGSVAGTGLLADINAGPATSLPEVILVVDGVVYFRAYRTNSTIKGLWRTDGTVAGTEALPDAVTGLHPYDMEMGPRLDGVQYFSANDTSHGRELWRTDGTPGGTFMIYDLRPGTGWSSPKGFTVVGSKVFFTATDGIHGEELCFTSGQRGNLFFADINPSSSGPEPVILEVLGSVLLFETYSSDHPSDKVLWCSDGTSQGTHVLLDTNTDVACKPGDEACLLPTGVWVFVADSAPWGRELWRTDGSASGTYLLKDIRSGTSWSSPSELRLVGDHVVFLADDGTHGRELWGTDGTCANTVLLADADGTSADGAYTIVSPAQTHAYPCFFLVTHPDTGHPVLGVTEGSPAGTLLLTDASTGQLANSPEFLLSSGALHYFAATNDVYGRELWRTDGTLSGTVMLTDAFSGTGWGAPEDLVPMGNMVFFTATSPATGREPWVTDGTKQGTMLLADIHPGAENSSAVNAVYSQISDRLYFRASDGVKSTMWETDGTPEGTEPSTAVVSRGAASRGEGDDVAFLGETETGVFLRGYTSAVGYELWYQALPGPPDPDSVPTPLPRPCINMAVGDTSFTGTLAMGVDADTTGQFVLLVPPAKGILALNPATGIYSYVPPTGEEFIGSFSYKIVTSVGQTLPRVVPIVVGSQSVSVTVASGWNLLSLPFGLGLAPEMILVRAGDTIFEGVPWAWSTVNASYVKVEDGFSALAGFWVFSQVSEPVTISIHGVDTGVRLFDDGRTNGWGLVGVSVATPASSIPRVGMPVWGHKDAKYLGVDTLLPGDGYWILTLPATAR